MSTGDEVGGAHAAGAAGRDLICLSALDARGGGPGGGPETLIGTGALMLRPLLLILDKQRAAAYNLDHHRADQESPLLR